MGQVVTFEGPREVGIREYEEHPLQANEVRLQTLYSGISAGTELTAYRESNPYLSKRWDDDRCLFLAGGVSLRHPIEGWGYEEVGEVAEVGSEVTEVRPGEVVWGTWGHKSTTVVHENWAAQRKLAPAVDPLVGIFSRIGLKQPVTHTFKIAGADEAFRLLDENPAEAVQVILEF